MAASRRPTGANHQKNRYFEKIYEEAVTTGEIKLNGRKLIDYPKIFQKGDLLDTVKCDISDNMYTEVPKKIIEYTYLEELNASHNSIRSLPDLSLLDCLTSLNLSYNKLDCLPETCLRNLKCLSILILSNNNLVSLSEEIVFLSSLTYLDCSSNEISFLPDTIKHCENLRILNLKSNKLVLLPVTLSSLKLRKLDLSSNRIEKLPYEMAEMNIECINLNYNPLKQPPSDIAKKGWKHIVKSLNRERKRELGEENRRSIGQFRHSSSFPAISSLSQQSQISSLSLPEYVPSKQRKPELVRRSSSSARPQPPPRTVSQLSNSRNSVSDLTTPETSPDSTPKNSPNMQNGHKNFSYSFSEDGMSPPNSAASITAYKLEPKTSPPMSRRSVAYSTSANVHQISPVKMYSPENNNGFHMQIPNNDKTPSPIQTDRKPSNFTIQRHEKQAVLRQSELYRTKRLIEEQLNYKLPENVTAALKDGVILCHLANQIWPHSIDRVHVPSVVDTELPTAKCQKNVNSFLTACRRMGVGEDFICPASVILEEKDPLELCRTVQKLLDLQTIAKASAV